MHSGVWEVQALTTLNAVDYIPHEAGSSFGLIEPGIAQHPKSNR